MLYIVAAVILLILGVFAFRFLYIRCQKCGSYDTVDCSPVNRNFTMRWCRHCNQPHN